MRRPSACTPFMGFLPVKVGSAPDKSGMAPTLQLSVASSDNLTADPATGITRPLAPRTINYEMVDTSVKRMGPDLGPIPTSQLEGETGPAKKAKRRGQ